MPQAAALSSNNVSNAVASNFPLGPQGFQVVPGNHGGLSCVAVTGNLLFVEAASSENYPGRMLITKQADWQQSGWYFSPFRGIFSSAIDNGKWYGLSDTMEVVWHAANAASMNYLKHQDLANHGTKWNAKGPMPTIPAVDSWKSEAGKQNADMHVRAGKMAISYQAHNLVRILNPDTGQEYQTLSVTSPTGVSVGTDGAVYVCTGGTVRRYASATATTVNTSFSALYSGLDTPWRIDVDTTYCYVSTLGNDHRVYVIKLSDNTLLRVDGLAGGRLDGLFNGLHYKHIVDIAADGNNNGGYYIVENTAPRRLVQRTGASTLGLNLRGPMQWAAPGAFNPDNPKEVFFRWTSDQIVLMEGSEDMRTWTIKAAWTFDHPMAEAGFGGGGEGDFYPKNHASQPGFTYLCRRADRDISVLKLNRSDYSLKPCFRYSCYETSIKAFQWTDANGDGNAQEEEYKRFAGDGSNYTDFGLVPAGDAMDYYAVRGDGLYKFPLLGFNSAGSPLYNFENGTKFFNGAFGRWYRQLTGAFALGPTRLFFIFSEQSTQQESIPGGGGWGMSHINKVYGFDRSTLGFLWERTAVTKPRTANNTTPANLAVGEVNTFKNILPRAIGDIAVINDFEGGWDDHFPATKYSIDKDGNWGLGPYQTVNTNHPAHWYVESTENGSGDIVRMEKTGKVYMLACTESFARMIEVTGPQGFTTAGTGTEEPVSEPQPLDLPFALNAGGDLSGAFSSDAYHQGGSVTSVPQAIDIAGVANAAPMAVYQSERFGDNESSFAYVFLLPKPNQNYQIRLHFAESWVAGRKFHINANGKRLETDLCVAEQAGGKNKALVKTYTAKSDANKKLQLDFIAGSVDWAKVNGIEIVGETVVIAPAPKPNIQYTRVFTIMATLANGTTVPMKVRFASTPEFEPEEFEPSDFT